MSIRFLLFLSCDLVSSKIGCSFYLGIDSIFRKIGCDRRKMEHLLQSHEGVTEENMLKYLGIIEERTNELLMAQAAIHAKVIEKCLIR